MGDDVGTIVNAEIEGVKLVVKGGEEAVKAIIKLFSMLFGKEAAERKKLKSEAALAEANTKAIENKEEINARLKAAPNSATMQDIIKTSEGNPAVIHLPKGYSKQNSAIAAICKDNDIAAICKSKGIGTGEIDRIMSNPVIEDKNAQLLNFLEKHPEIKKELLKRETKVPLNCSMVDYLRIKNGVPTAKSKIDDNPKDGFDCFFVRAQELAFWANIEKIARDEYKKSKEEYKQGQKATAEHEDKESEKATDPKEKKQHKKNADKAREAMKEADEDIKTAEELDKKGPQSMEEFAQNETVKESLKDVNAEKTRTGQHWEEKPEEAFKPVYSPDKMPENGKRYYAGKNGSYAVREYEVIPEHLVTTLKDDGTEDYKMEPAKVNSSYSIYDKNGKAIGDLYYDERQCSPKQWKEQVVPEMMEKLGLTGAAAVTVGETKDAIMPTDVERSQTPLSEDAKEFQRNASESKEKTENFNKAAEYKSVKNLGGNERTAVFEAELSDGSRVAIGVPNDKDHIKKNEDGTYNVSLQKNEKYPAYQTGEKGYKKLDKSIKPDNIKNLTSGMGKTAPAKKPVTKSPTRK